MGSDHLNLPDTARRARAETATNQDAQKGRTVTAMDRWLADGLARTLAEARFTVVLWDGSEFGASSSNGIRIHAADRGALYGLVTSPEVNFGDLYSVERVEIEGDLVTAVREAYGALNQHRNLRNWFANISRFRWARPSQSRSRQNIHHHYDIGNDFYRLWLDRDALQYTCAYYPTPELTLEQAQAAKMDHVCRKLWLQRGDTVAEAGCGWGGFAIFMAKRYGVRVRAFNISQEQIAYAKEWAEREAVTDRVEFVKDDYRNITGKYDVFVSIGMLEHVGPANYVELGRLIGRCLKADGRGLIHNIGRDRPAPLNRWIRKRIFPGAYPPTLREMTDIFERSGLSVLDVENLRLHYEATLLHWLDRFERSAEKVRSLFDERFVRAWRLYLAGSAAAFNVGSLQLFQVLFTRTGCNAVPTGREHVYATEMSQPALWRPRRTAGTCPE